VFEALEAAAAFSCGDRNTTKTSIGEPAGIIIPRKPSDQYVADAMIAGRPL